MRLYDRAAARRDIMRLMGKGFRVAKARELEGEFLFAMRTWDLPAALVPLLIAPFDFRRALDRRRGYVDLFPVPLS